MRYRVIHPDDCSNNYLCVVNGNEIVAMGSDYKRIRNRCTKFAIRGYYSELWFVNSAGDRSLIEYWN